MGAPAVAPRRAPARRAPTRKPRRKPRANPAVARPRSATRARTAARPRTVRPNPAYAGAALIPHAAARTAGAVRDISDSSLIVRLTVGRGWIAVLCALLGGIVALNVISLSINATSGKVTQGIEHYERQNSALRAELAEKLSAGRVEDAAVALGLHVPAPEDVSYLDSRDSDLSKLADLLGGDTFLSSDSSDFVPSDTYAPGTVPSEAYVAPPTSSGTAAPPTSSAPPSAAPAPSTSGTSSGSGATGGVGL